MTVGELVQWDQFRLKKDGVWWIVFTSNNKHHEGVVAMTSLKGGGKNRITRIFKADKKIYEHWRLT